MVEMKDNVACKDKCRLYFIPNSSISLERKNYTSFLICPYPDQSFVTCSDLHRPGFAITRILHSSSGQNWQDKFKFG